MCVFQFRGPRKQNLGVGVGIVGVVSVQIHKEVDISTGVRGLRLPEFVF